MDAEIKVLYLRREQLLNVLSFDPGGHVNLQSKKEDGRGPKEMEGTLNIDTDAPYLLFCLGSQTANLPS